MNTIMIACYIKAALELDRKNGTCYYDRLLSMSFQQRVRWIEFKERQAEQGHPYAVELVQHAVTFQLIG